MSERLGEFVPFMPLDSGADAYVVARDGDRWGAYSPGFVDLAVSDVAWAATPEEALRKLRAEVRVKAGPEADAPNGG